MSKLSTFLSDCESLNAALNGYLRQFKVPEQIAAEVVQDSAPVIRKIVKGKANLDLAKKAMVLLAKGRGLHTPLIALGLKPAPKRGAQWMANVRVARFEIDAEEYVAELKKEIEFA